MPKIINGVVSVDPDSVDEAFAYARGYLLGLKAGAQLGASELTRRVRETESEARKLAQAITRNHP